MPNLKLSAFTFLRNAEMLGYPYLESIQSLLPFVDEFVVNVGAGDDDTLAKIQNLAVEQPKMRVIQSEWNEKMASMGFVYAQQKMIAQYNCTGDWAFYLEGDEVLHEQDGEKLRSALETYHDNPDVEALAFKYYHFYGTANQVATSPAWYRSEARVIRNTIRTYAPDGLFWIVMDKHKRGRYPKAILLDAHIYHYGHVRPKEKMQTKINQISKYWDLRPAETNYGNIDPTIIKPWQGKHPAVMQSWLKQNAPQVWQPNPGYKLSRREKKHRISMQIERLFKMVGIELDLSKNHYKKLNTEKSMHDGF